MMMKNFSLVMVVLAGLAAAGCATQSQGVRIYAGEARAAGEVAQLVAASEFDVRSVGGVKGAGGMFSRAGEMVFEVLPGAHEVVARFYSPFEGGSSVDKVDRSDLQTLRFDAAAGRRYMLKRKTENGAVKLFIAEAGASVDLGSSAVAMKQAERVTPPVQAPSVVDASGAAPKEKGVEAPRITPLDNLKQWWFYASPEERAQFRQWMDSGK